jgi:hypothetical protein
VNLGQAVNAVVQPLLLGAALGRKQAPGEASHWRYRSFAELLLREGFVFTAPTADLVPEHRRGPAGQCFANAAAYSADDGLIYAEGFAGTAQFRFGVEHAWCLAESGAVLDPTWPLGLGAVYVGLAVTAVYQRSVAHPSMLHPHSQGLVILRHGLPVDALVTFSGDGSPRSVAEFVPEA